MARYQGAVVHDSLGAAKRGNAGLSANDHSHMNLFIQIRFPNDPGTGQRQSLATPDLHTGTGHRKLLMISGLVPS
jgi:hypothetical protein